jgi:RNA polymerase sigma-70 factor (ECF subfamily)
MVDACIEPSDAVADPISLERGQMSHVDSGDGMQETVERAISGDHDAFSELVRASSDRLYAVATLILRDGDRAQDAVQEALVSAWRDIRALRDPDAWEGWLYRLTVRACYRQARKERRRTTVEIHVIPRDEPDGAADFSLSYADRDRLEREIGRLTLDQRAVMVLHFYADLTLERAAEILDVPVGTVKSRLHYGLRALRESMRAEPEVLKRNIRERTA